MQVDFNSVLIGAGGIVALGFVAVVSLGYLYFIWRSRTEAKKKMLAKTHRKDLSALVTVLDELLYTNLGFLALSIVVLVFAKTTGVTVENWRFYAIASMALATWYIFIPGRGLFQMRSVLREITTPSESTLAPQTEDSAKVTPLAEHRRAV